MLNRETFEHRYRQLEYVTRQKGSEPSFTSGLWFDEEGYKQNVWKQARTALQPDTWEEHKDDYKYICDRAIEAITACGNLLATDNSQYALQEYESTFTKVVIAFLENKQTVAEALYGIFSTEDTENDSIYFDKLAAVLRKIYDGYSYVAYFFFLKNKDKYAPVRRKRMTIHLRLLDVNPACMDPCNWKNYEKYMETIREIKQLLDEKGLEPTLLDAQSFLWMLWMIEADTPEYAETEPEFHDYAEGTVNISKDQWIELIRNGIITDIDIEYLAKFYASPNHASTPKRLSEIEGTHPSSYISPCTSLGRKISGIFSIPAIPREGNPDSEKLYPMIFLGRRLSNGLFEWKLRPELAAALEETNPQILAAETVRMEEAEEEEAVQLSVDELLARARNYHSGPADTYISTTQQRRRNSLLQIAAKARANGVCQLCGITLDFKDKQGRPYLEAHHIIPLAENGLDELSNMAALCPNCHRKMHVVGDRDDIAKLMALAEF